MCAVCSELIPQDVSSRCEQREDLKGSHREVSRHRTIFSEGRDPLAIGVDRTRHVNSAFIYPCSAIINNRRNINKLALKNSTRECSGSLVVSAWGMLWSWHASRSNSR